MRSFPAAIASDGLYLTPHEINAEVAEIASVVNSLDLYNFEAGEISHAKLEAGACGDLHVDRLTSSNSQDSTNDRTVRGVPDEDDDPWVVEFASGDGYLRVTCGGWVSASTVGLAIWVGIRVDGELVASQALTSGLADAAWHIEGDIAVGAETHLIEVVWQGYQADGFLIAYTNTYTWKDRHLTIREFAR